MRHKASEVKGISAVLESQHDSAEDAAKAVLEALAELRRDERHLALIRFDHGYPSVLAPFSTTGQVQKALQKGYGGSKWAVGYIRSPEGFEAAREATEAVVEAHLCSTCNHPKVAHVNRKWNANTAKGAPDWRNPGCMVCPCVERH